MPTLITAHETTTNATAGNCEFEQQQQQPPPPLLPTQIHNPYDTTTSTITMGPQSQQNNSSIKKCRKAAITYLKKNKGSLKSIWFLGMRLYSTGLSTVNTARNTKNTSKQKSRKESESPTNTDITTPVSLGEKT
jgi:hypothetical protein